MVSIKYSCSLISVGDPLVRNSHYALDCWLIRTLSSLFHGKLYTVEFKLLWKWPSRANHHADGLIHCENLNRQSSNCLSLRLLCVRCIPLLFHLTLYSLLKTAIMMPSEFLYNITDVPALNHTFLSQHVIPALNALQISLKKIRADLGPRWRRVLLSFLAVSHHYHTNSQHTK